MPIEPAPGIAPEPLPPGPAFGETLHEFRFAAGLTGDYTWAFGGGTVSGALSGLASLVNAANGFLEREAAVRLVVVDGEDKLVFTDPETDGYTHGDRFTLIPENQQILDAVLGPGGYDIGHALDGTWVSSFTSFSGAAACCVCYGSSKGSAASVFTRMPPTDYWAAYHFTHEIGHQLSASHTFNATTTDLCASQRVDWTAYEPGAGATIMGYGINCGDEGFSGWNPYFHTASLEQIASWVAATPPECGTASATGRTPPFVSAGPSRTIPVRTPFRLTGEQTAAEGDTVTYSWEQFDLGNASPPNTDDGTRPIFHSQTPDASSSRMFPGLTDVLDGVDRPGDTLPVTTRTLTFRLTARAVRDGLGAVATAATQLRTEASAGPFVVTAPGSGTIWIGSGREPVEWDVAGTDAPPVSCSSVRILLSTDEGASFNVALAEETPNDGSETITVPQALTFDARVWVGCTDNVFFNVSRPDFSIYPGCTDGGGTHRIADETCANERDDDCDGSTDGADADCGPLPQAPPPDITLSACTSPPEFAWITGRGQRGFRLTVSGAETLSAPRWRTPALAGASFTPTPAQWLGALKLAREAAADRTLYWGVSAVADGKLQGPARSLTIGAPHAPEALLPADGATQPAESLPVFSWEAGECNRTFRVELAGEAGFAGGRIARSERLSLPGWSPAATQWAGIIRRLGPLLTWRVAATDPIGRVTYSPARALNTQ